MEERKTRMEKIRKRDSQPLFSSLIAFVKAEQPNSSHTLKILKVQSTFMSRWVFIDSDNCESYYHEREARKENYDLLTPWLGSVFRLCKLVKAQGYKGVDVSLSNNVFADPIFPSHIAGSFGHSSREPKYKIEFHTEDSVYQPDDGQESVVMPNKDGKNFLCFLPKVEKAKKTVTHQNNSSLIVETEKRVKLKTPDELLEQEGWWSYEFCYQKQLRQLHLEEDKVNIQAKPVMNTQNRWFSSLDCSVVQEFVLGVYDEEATAASNQNLSDISTLKDPRSKDTSQRYHAHQYTNGTLCDLTNQPRETEVRFVCSEPRTMISSITELATCKYALTIQCPMLCKHPLFQEERPVWHTINCNILPKDTKVDDTRITMVVDSDDQSGFDSRE
ncbi:Protein OS-9-like protein [Hibiscus syriacus]|uniref:Protein OS-9-like protein n=1 Tax=Hibiscus syriacus TaxID=106335 RepID=A0A6A2XTG1_HIBSY|nr:Protein OS-9-like protein [Hibiscus syriacus]